MRKTLRNIALATCLMTALPVYAQSSPGGLSLPQNLSDVTSQRAHDERLDTLYNPWLTAGPILGNNSKLGLAGRTNSYTKIVIKGHRDITTFLYFPSHVSNAEIPVVIVSTQYDTSPVAYNVLFNHLASQGYLVIAPLHQDVSYNVTNVKTDEDTQSRINDIHDMIRSIPIVKNMTHMNISPNYSLVGFHDGDYDCLMNSGLPSDNPKITAWPGAPQSITLVSPVEGDIPQSFANLSTPVMAVSTIDGLNIQKGILAQMPEDGIRLLVAFDGFNDPLMSIADETIDKTFMWKSLLTTWLNATMMKDMKAFDAFKSQDFEQHSNGVIKTQIEIAKNPGQ